MQTGESVLEQEVSRILETNEKQKSLIMHVFVKKKCPPQVFLSRKTKSPFGLLTLFLNNS